MKMSKIWKIMSGVNYCLNSDLFRPRKLANLGALQRGFTKRKDVEICLKNYNFGPKI